jgi:two-component system phosphate regulon response regulator PhoB
MPDSKILIVEDDPALGEVLEYNFTQAGFDVQLARNGRDALRLAKERVPDLVVLDIMLPEIDGIEVCRRLRSQSATRKTLILMLTAKAEETDQVIGFSVGADDYVIKPFSVAVLQERVKALLRRREDQPDQRDVIISQGISIDRRRHRVMAGNEPLEFTKSEFELLLALAKQPGRVFTRNELIDAALGDDVMVLERTIDVHIRAIRKKLGPFAELIETVRGLGYRFREPHLEETEVER